MNLEFCRKISISRQIYPRRSTFVVISYNSKDFSARKYSLNKYNCLEQKTSMSRLRSMRSTKSSLPREEETKTKNRITRQQNSVCEKIKKYDDEIKSFCQLRDIIDKTNEYQIWKENWNIFVQTDGICFYRLSRDENFDDIKISFKIIVNKNLKVILRNEFGIAESIELEWILKYSKLEMWSQLHQLLDFYQSEPEIKLQTNQSTFTGADNVKLINPLMMEIETHLFFQDQSTGVDIKQEIIEPTRAMSVDRELMADETKCSSLDQTANKSSEDELRSYKENIPETLNFNKTTESNPVNTENTEESVGADNFKCTLCDKSFYSKKIFYSHKRNFHVSFF